MSYRLPGCGDRPAQLDQSDHHVGHEHDLVLVDGPAQAPAGEAGERAPERRTCRPGIAEVVAVDRAMERLRDGRREREVHLGDRRADHVGVVGGPLLAGAAVQRVEAGDGPVGIAIARWSFLDTVCSMAEVMVMACLNGGRSRAEHAAVPYTPAELAADAVAIRKAGAFAVHVRARCPRPPDDGGGRVRRGGRRDPRRGSEAADRTDDVLGRRSRPVRAPRRYGHGVRRRTSSRSTCPSSAGRGSSVPLCTPG